MTGDICVTLWQQCPGSNRAASNPNRTKYTYFSDALRDTTFSMVELWIFLGFRDILSLLFCDGSKSRVSWGIFWRSDFHAWFRKLGRNTDHLKLYSKEGHNFVYSADSSLYIFKFPCPNSVYPCTAAPRLPERPDAVMSQSWPPEWMQSCNGSESKIQLTKYRVKRNCTTEIESKWAKKKARKELRWLQNKQRWYVEGMKRKRLECSLERCWKEWQRTGSTRQRRIPDRFKRSKRLEN